MIEMVHAPKVLQKRLGEILVEEGLLKEQQVREALEKQKAKGNGTPLGSILVELGYTTEVNIAHAICKQTGLPYLDASEYLVNKEALGVFSAEFMYQHEFIVLDKMGKVLIIAFSGSLDQKVFDELERESGSTVRIYVSTPTHVMAALKKYLPPTEDPNAKTIKDIEGV